MEFTYSKFCSVPGAMLDDGDTPGGKIPPAREVSRAFAVVSRLCSGEV